MKQVKDSEIHTYEPSVKFTYEGRVKVRAKNEDEAKEIIKKDFESAFENIFGTPPHK
jgi:hypothetical protein